MKKGLVHCRMSTIFDKFQAFLTKMGEFQEAERHSMALAETAQLCLMMLRMADICSAAIKLVRIYHRRENLSPKDLHALKAIIVQEDGAMHDLIASVEIFGKDEVEDGA